MQIFYTLLKYFAIIYCSIYASLKILSTNRISRSTYLISLAYSGLMSIPFIFIPKGFSPFHTLLAIGAVLLYLRLFCHLTAHTVLAVSVISHALSVTAYLCSIILAAFLYISKLGNHIPDVLQECLISLIQLIFTTMIFRIRRFKNGMPFLINYRNNMAGIHIASIIILCEMIIKSGEARLIYIIPLTFILIGFILLYIWWCERIKAAYLKRMALKELSFLNSELAALKHDNEALSAMIHRDNKLIPALIMAIEEYLQCGEKSPGIGKDLLSKLEQLADERKNILHSCPTLHNILTTTGLTSIDALMNYMFQKALTKKINIMLALDSPQKSNASSGFSHENAGSFHAPSENSIVSRMADEVIPESELCTLLADMLENAIIATTCNDGHEILVRFVCFKDNTYCIEIADSGIPFKAEVLVNFGRKRITTHKESGGTGIGLNTIYHIADLHNASIIIDETCSSVSGLSYTKKMSVVFDNRHQYILRTDHRNTELPVLRKRADLLINPGSDE